MSATADKTPAGPPPVAIPKLETPADMACETVKRRMPLVLVISGALLLVALLVAGWQSSLPARPKPVQKLGQATAPVLDRAVLVCSLDAHASRNPTPDSASVLMTFDRTRSCANGHTVYQAGPEGFSRTLFMGSGRTLSVMRLSPDMTHLERRDYFLDAPEFARLRKVRGRVRAPVCSRQLSGRDPVLAAAVRSSAEAARPFTQETPGRLMSWTCSAQPVGGFRHGR
jgi:hypothetical protein